MFLLVKAAEYIGVDPEWFRDRSVFWYNWALACRNIEIAGEAELEKRWRKLKKGH